MVGILLKAAVTLYLGVSAALLYLFTIAPINALYLPYLGGVGLSSYGGLLTIRLICKEPHQKALNGA